MLGPELPMTSGFFPQTLAKRLSNIFPHLFSKNMLRYVRFTFLESGIFCGQVFLQATLWARKLLALGKHFSSVHAIMLGQTKSLCRHDQDASVRQVY